MEDLKIGETRRTQSHTVHRSFGRLTFAIADNIDRDFVYQQISGDNGGELIAPNTLALDIIGHNVPPIAQEGFMSLDRADLLSVGMFSLVFNESVVSGNEQARAKLNAFAERIAAMLETEADVSVDSIKIMEEF